MLTTIELESYIKHQVESKIKGVSWQSLWHVIYFKEGNGSSSMGSYVFVKDEKYHYLIVGDRGGVSEDCIMTRIEDVLYRVVNAISFGIAHEYAKRIRNSGSGSFRRTLHEKEIEIFSLFGEEFKEKKCKEIEEHLKQCPYDD